MGTIARFLDQKTLFVTGATGFLAGGLVEKILRAAPGVKRVYLLIRSGKQGTTAERFEREILQANVFHRLREQHGTGFDAFARSKLVPVAGDLTQERLGIAPEEYARLASEVDILINSAASVVFDEELDHALNLNTLGPRRLVDFAKSCRSAIFLHVSTAYVNGQRTGRVPEELLPANRSLAQIIDPQSKMEFDLEAEIESITAFARQARAAAASPMLATQFRRNVEREHAGRPLSASRKKHHIEAQRKRWLKRQLVDEGMRRARRLGWHDSYTLTKAMGEMMVAKHRGDLPVAILRPSIIESSLAEPVPGWLDGLKVADPLIMHYSKGRLPDFPADPSIVLDLIPVDMVSNAMLAALPAIRRSDPILVYHVASGSENPLTLGQMFELIYSYFQQHPLTNRQGEAIRVQRWTYPSLEQFRRSFRLKYVIPMNAAAWVVNHFTAFRWPARFRQRVSLMEATLERVLSLLHIYSPYMHLDCQFDTANTRRLYESLDAVERAVFNFDVKTINWREYIQDIHLQTLMRSFAKEGNGQRGALAAGPDGRPLGAERTTGTYDLSAH